MGHTLSIILLTWNSEKDIQPCLSSLIEATCEYEREIIVVDNGSTDHTVQELESFKNDIKLIILKQNLGVAKSRNIALRECTKEFIWILDIDTIVNKDSIDGMVNYLSQESQCGLCACKLTDENGNVQDSCRKLPWPQYKALNILTSPKFSSLLPTKINNWLAKKNESQFYHQEISLGIPFSAEYVIGACQVFRKDLLKEIGYLEEKIFYGPEDADFCQRISQSGKKIMVLPQYTIIHHYNRLSQKRIFSASSYKHTKGLLYFYIKQIINILR